MFVSDRRNDTREMPAGLGMSQAVASATHLVLIPSYNTGLKLAETVRAARHYWDPVLVVIDGSTDGTADAALRYAERIRGVSVLVQAQNRGKGAAVLAGLREAQRRGFTHVLTMDADGQHPAELIPQFMAMSKSNPRAVVLGVPQYDASAPWIRVFGHWIANWWADVATLWAGIEDVLFGFRVYPVSDLRDVMDETRWMRGFDFDPEAAVRLCWRGLRLVNCPAPVKYFSLEEDGVSHFRYLRDNALLAWMNARLISELLLRIATVANLRAKARTEAEAS